MSSDTKHECTIIDGLAVSAKIKAQLKEKIASSKASFPHATPKLSVVLVGERKDSQSYVKMKTKACEEVGIISDQHNVPHDTTQEDLLELVQKLNNDPSVNGILVQLPLPDHINAEKIIHAIDPNKDVDGLHPQNTAHLYALGMKAPFLPCTPLGCIVLLQEIKAQIEGKHAVVVGRSNLVGKPVSLLLLSMNATVTVCHSKTPQQSLQDIIGRADIVIAAAGRPAMIKGDWIRPGAIVLDVGVNPVTDATKKQGYRLVGDVEFESAKQRASAITPVPGGVGPMTVAMLLSNTVNAFQRTLNPL